MPAFARCLAAMIETLGLERPHILGLSWGSTLALELYRQRPDVPRTLLLAAPYAGWAGSLPPETVAERVATTLRDLGSLEPEAYARTWVPSLFTPRAPREVVEEAVRTMAGFRPSGVRPMLFAMAEADLREVLPEVRVPTLLLCGAEDVRSPLEVVEVMHAAIPGSTLVVLPEVGHMANLEAPEAFNRAVRSFLSALGT
jgi:pimeloyl-ACP methyl ester carboxylesterase